MGYLNTQPNFNYEQQLKGIEKFMILLRLNTRFKSLPIGETIYPECHYFFYFLKTE